MHYVYRIRSVRVSTDYPHGYHHLQATQCRVPMLRYVIEALAKDALHSP
jgi:hypothetical protein